MIGREDEVQTLAGLACAGQGSRLVAPRRYGKTSLLRVVGEHLAQEGFVFVHVDFSRVRWLDDVALRLRSAWERALSRAGTRRLWRRLDKRLGTHLEVGLPGVVRGGINVAPATQARPLEAVHELLAIPEHLHGRGGRRAFVVFDEFSELLTARDDLDGIVRSHIQHHGQAASYCFSGSEASVMRVLFEDRRRPLFAQAREVALGPLPEAELRFWLADVFDRPDAPPSGAAADPASLAAMISERAHGHPQRAMMLAHFIWERLPVDDPGDLRSAVAAAVNEASGEIEQMWRDLQPGQRRALATAAVGYRHLLGPKALAASGAAKTTMQAARRTLLADGHLREHGQGGVQVTDPFVALWLAETDSSD